MRLVPEHGAHYTYAAKKHMNTALIFEGCWGESELAHELYQLESGFDCLGLIIYIMYHQSISDQALTLTRNYYDCYSARSFGTEPSMQSYTILKKEC